MAKTPAVKTYIVTYFRNRDLAKAAAGDSIALRVVEVEATSTEEATSKATTKTRTVVRATKRGRGKVKEPGTILKGDALTFRYFAGSLWVDGPQEIDGVKRYAGARRIEGLDLRSAEKAVAAPDFSLPPSVVSDGLASEDEDGKDELPTDEPESVSTDIQSEPALEAPTEELVSGNFQAPVAEADYEQQSSDAFAEANQRAVERQEAIAKIDEQIESQNWKIARFESILQYNAASEGIARRTYLSIGEDMDRFEDRLTIRPVAISHLIDSYGELPGLTNQGDDTFEEEITNLQERVENQRTRDEYRSADTAYYKEVLAETIDLVKGLTLLRSELTGDTYVDPFAEQEQAQDEETEYETAPPVLYLMLAVVALGALGAAYGFQRTLLVDLLRFAITLAMFFLGGAFSKSYAERDAAYCDDCSECSEI